MESFYNFREDGGGSELFMFIFIGKKMFLGCRVYFRVFRVFRCLFGFIWVLLFNFFFMGKSIFSGEVKNRKLVMGLFRCFLK